jgi:hypothetical protein
VKIKDELKNSKVIQIALGKPRISPITSHKISLQQEFQLVLALELRLQLALRLVQSNLHEQTDMEELT